VLEWTSTCATDPVSEKLPSGDEVDAMIADDIVDYYQEITAKSGSPTPPAVFHKWAVADTANEFGRTDGRIRAVLRNAGYGRGKTTARSD
jgi:hypothetical protein